MFARLSCSIPRARPRYVSPYYLPRHKLFSGLPDSRPSDPKSAPPAGTGSATNSNVDIAATTFLCSTAVSAVSLSSLSTAAALGVDFNALIDLAGQYIPFLASIQLDPMLGTVAAILIVHKLFAPLRYSIAAAMTPFALPAYRSRFKPWWNLKRQKQSE
jgi:hypothetical protein